MTPVTVLGIGVRQMMQDVEHSDVVFAWGKNSVTDDGPQPMLKRIKAAKERGAKLVVVDPRRSGLGEMADVWVPVTPGSDGALALAMTKIIVEEGRYDHDFVSEFVRGFDEYAEYLRGLDGEWLSQKCGVGTDVIRRLTDLFCSTEKISLVSYTGLEYQLSAVQNNRAIYVMWAITGKLDVEGGICLNARGESEFQLKDLPDADERPVGADKFPLFYRFTGEGQFSCFPEAVLEDDPYPVRGLLVVGGSPALSFPGGQTWQQAYSKLDCLIVLDRFFTEEARYADVVLPSCSLYETPRVVASKEGPKVEKPVLPAVGEARNDVLALSDLARRLGVGEGYPEDEESLRTWLLSGPIPYAGDFTIRPAAKERSYRSYKSGKLRADGKPGFPTPSGKLEIASTILEENGFSPCPEYHDIRELPEMADRKFDFTLTSGSRSDTRMGAFGANLPGIVAIEPEPLAEISEEDARELGISDGDRVRVTTPFGEGTFGAKVCGMARKSVHIPHGGGSGYMVQAWRDGNVNKLASLQHRDPVTGFVTFKSVPCSVVKA